MDRPDKIDLTNAKQRRAAEQATAEKVVAEVEPLFHDADRKAWAHLEIPLSAKVDSHYETFAVDSDEMKYHLRRAYFEKSKAEIGIGLTLSKRDLTEMIEKLEARAQFEGPQCTVCLRAGEHDGALYLDLCDPLWRAVRISGGGWEVLGSAPSPPTLFRRTEGMLSLPIPEQGGTAEELKSFLNVTDSQFVLIQGWLLGALRSRGPFPLLVLHGPAGSAKTSLCQMLRDLTDPNSVPLLPAPHDTADLDVAAMHSHVLVFDNISRLSQRLSDSFCRLATGGGTVRRQFFTRQRQVRFPHVARPMIANGITEFISAPDLLDRAIIIPMPYIKVRRTEAEFLKDFQLKRARILGALLDRMVVGIRNLPSTELKETPRMADFCKWCAACGLKNFEVLYTQNRVDATLALLEGDPLAIAIKGLMEHHRTWEGNASELIKALKQYGLEEPSDARVFSINLRKLASALESGLSITLEFPPRRRDTRLIRLTKA
jgi:hypothetical protein